MCGGPSGLDLFDVAGTAVIPAAPLYIGCFKDASDSRRMRFVSLGGVANNNAECAKRARAAGYAVAGTQ